VDDGTRTHDGRDHNPGLYQLSYVHHRHRQELSRINGLRSSIPFAKLLMILKSLRLRQAQCRHRHLPAPSQGGEVYTNGCQWESGARTSCFYTTEAAIDCAMAFVGVN
jgi:hypothetical protein